MGQGMAGAKIAAQSGNPDHLENFYDFAHRRGELTRKTREHLIGTVAANSPKARRFLEKMQRNGNTVDDDDGPPPAPPDDEPNPDGGSPRSFLRSPMLLERWGAVTAGAALPESLAPAPNEAAQLRRLAELRALAERTGAFDDRLAYVMAALGG
jgi:hypothetical protein